MSRPLKLKHSWRIYFDQTDTGYFGVRLWCTAHRHKLTVHEDLLDMYIGEPNE